MNLRTLMPLCLTLSLGAAETVQLDLRGLLNARPVTVLAQGKLVAWRDGIDGPWSGEATQAATLAMGSKAAKALPDDGRVASRAGRPEVQLHFRNGEGEAPQVRRALKGDAFTLPASGRFQQLYLFAMSANGDSRLKVELEYADGRVTRTLVVPDWGVGAKAGDPLAFNLLEDFGKWNTKHEEMEPDHHYLVGLDLQPDPARSLKAIHVQKDEAGTFTLWAATGVRN